LMKGDMLSPRARNRKSAPRPKTSRIISIIVSPEIVRSSTARLVKAGFTTGINQSPETGWKMVS
jgi:hypothetical protein